MQEATVHIPELVRPNFFRPLEYIIEKEISRHCANCQCKAYAERENQGQPVSSYQCHFPNLTILDDHPVTNQSQPLPTNSLISKI